MLVFEKAPQAWCLSKTYQRGDEIVHNFFGLVQSSDLVEYTDVQNKLLKPEDRFLMQKHLSKQILLQTELIKAHYSNDW